MLDIDPKNLFDIGEDAWKGYILSRAGQDCIDPNNLPSFDNVTKYVDSTENPMAKVIIQNPHYFMAFLVAQNKNKITQPYFLNICNHVYQQDIKASGTPKKSASNVQDSSGESDGIGKPKAVTHQSLKQTSHECGAF